MLIRPCIQESFSIKITFVKYLSYIILTLVLLGLWSCSDIGDLVSCSEELDCAGECGGSAVEDDCGICGGDGTSCINISYSEIIQPILINCTDCHDGTHSTGLDLTSYNSLITGSYNGAVIVPSDSSTGLLMEYIKSGYMPLSGNLSISQINRIATWIQEGALNN